MSYKDTERERQNPVERIACPMCGWIRTVRAREYKRTTPYHKAGEPREVRFDKVDVEHAPIWRLDRLSGKGRGSKEATIELVDSKTLAELPAELKEQIKRQCNKILEILK
ncbi:hypothetical protein ES707_15663 [subsurface metagenome]